MNSFIIYWSPDNTETVGKQRCIEIVASEPYNINYIKDPDFDIQLVAIKQLFKRVNRRYVITKEDYQTRPKISSFVSDNGDYCYCLRNFDDKIKLYLKMENLVV